MPRLERCECLILGSGSGGTFLAWHLARSGMRTAVVERKWIGGGEVMAVVQTAMLGGLPYRALRDAVITHPTMAEGLGALFSEIPERRLRRVKNLIMAET